MPSAFALQVYGVTGRQQDGATLQQEMRDPPSGVAGPPSPRVYGVAGRNVPPPLIPVPAKPDSIAFLACFARVLFHIHP